MAIGILAVFRLATWSTSIWTSRLFSRSNMATVDGLTACLRHSRPLGQCVASTRITTSLCSTPAATGEVESERTPFSEDADLNCFHFISIDRIDPNVTKYLHHQVDFQPSRVDKGQCGAQRGSGRRGRRG